MNQRPYRAITFTFLSSFLWGSSFVAVKVGLRSIDPVWFTFWRTFLAGLVLTVVVRKAQLGFYFRNRLVWALAVLNTSAFLAQNYGMQITTASKAAFYVNFGFVAVALFSWIFLRERFTWLKISSLLLGAVGVTFLVTGGHLSRLKGGTLLGDGLVILAGWLWAGYFIVSKIVLHQKGVRVLPLTAVVLLGTGIVSLPAAALIAPREAALGTTGLVIVLYTAAFCTAVPQLLWARGLMDLTPTASAVVLLAEPIFGALFGFLLLGDRFTLGETVGAVLILLAIGLYSMAEAPGDDQ